MKKLLLIMLMSVGVLTVQAQVMVPTHFDAQTAAQHILKGHIKMYLNDTSNFIVEKKNNRYVTDYNVDKDVVKRRIDKVFAKGKPEYSSRTNGGYSFTIAVIDFKDELKVLNYVTFRVSAWNQKIIEIEILKGE
jgi:hypothetical protein